MNSHSISSRTPRIAPRWRSGRRMSLLITASSGWKPLEPSSASTSVGEILYSLAVAYPAANTFPIGESLMQAILSPQEAADLLFFLISAMSMVNATLQPEPSLTIAEGIIKLPKAERELPMNGRPPPRS